MSKALTLIVLIIAGILGVTLFGLYSETVIETETVIEPETRSIPVPESVTSQVIVFEPKGDIKVCSAMNCTLLYNDKKCGNGFFVKSNGEYVTQAERYMISEPEIVKNWDNCQ